MTNTKVVIEKCNSYDEVYLKKSLKKVISNFEILKDLKSGSKILLKANLVIRKRPDSAATTNPKFLKVLAEILINMGYEVIVGDSPGGVYNRIFLKSVYRVCGLTQEFKTTKIKLNYNTEITEIDNPNGLVLKKLFITKYIEDVDFIINIPKLKSHVMMVYTGAVKNMFGIVPGEKKAEFHFNAPNYDDFADNLIDVCISKMPHLNIMDGIIGMEGQGPTSGKPLNVGLILASENPFNLDYVALNIINIEPKIVPIIKMSIKRNLLKDDINKIEIVGESIDSVKLNSFEYVKENNLKSVIFTDNIIIKNIVDKLRPKPIINYNNCIKCKECYNVCPVKTIDFDNGYPEIIHKNCIKCFCCHELCPVSAISIKKSKILIFSLKLGSLIKSLNLKIKNKDFKKDEINKIEEE
jgi:uncharacterized protein (DUF362 family)/NAD-dependent dihydropyrimidine dehydrogenase PreA subunit